MKLVEYIWLTEDEELVKGTYWDYDPLEFKREYDERYGYQNERTLYRVVSNDTKLIHIMDTVTGVVLPYVNGHKMVCPDEATLLKELETMTIEERIMRRIDGEHPCMGEDDKKQLVKDFNSVLDWTDDGLQESRILKILNQYGEYITSDLWEEIVEQYTGVDMQECDREFDYGHDESGPYGGAFRDEADLFRWREGYYPTY